MITLKDYQTRVLDSLRDFFRDCAKTGRPDEAFKAVQLRNNRQPAPYVPVQATGLAAGMPYVCQSFRVEDTTGRKVYDQNGAFAEHLLNVPSDRLRDLLPGADGKPKPSLVNMLRLRRPIVIVDEAHNARTDLSFSTLGDLLPSAGEKGRSALHAKIDAAPTILLGI